MRILRFVFCLLFAFCSLHTYGAGGSSSTFSSATSKEEDKIIQSQNEEAFIKKLLKAYKDDLEAFSGIIYSDISNEKGEKHKRIEDLEMEVIYNQDVYDEGIPDFLPPSLPKRIVIRQGKPLVLNDGTSRGIPVGYKIYLPKGDVKAVFVSVYGGIEASNRSKKYLQPSLNDLENYLMSKGIAIVQLNLVDLLDLNVFQLAMPKDLHAKLHDGINYFFKTLKKNPTAFHEDLTVLAGKKIYLFGASFGGRTAIRHAELYPDTFAGYISHDGELSFETLYKSDIVPRDERGRLTQDWLSPSNEPSGTKKIQEIKDPILLLHNRDDNNINIKVTLDWYHQALQLVKDGKNLIRLYITRMGNSDRSLQLKGHLSPTDKEAFKAYAQNVFSFMTEKLLNIPAISEWRAHHEEILANKNYRSATLEEKFLSLAYRLYQAESNRQYKEAMDTHTPLSTAGTAAGIFVKGQRKGSWTTQQEESWNKFYVPIFYTLAYLEDLRENETKLQAVLNQIRLSGALTERNLENGLKQQLPSFLEYLKTHYNLEAPNSLDADSLAKNKNLQSLYKDFLTNPEELYSLGDFRKNLAIYLLYTLYLGNLDQKGLPLPYHNDVKDEEEREWKGKLDDLKTKLIQKIEGGEQHIKAAWSQVAKTALSKKADRRN